MAAMRRSGCAPFARKGSVTSASRKRCPGSCAVAAPLAAPRCRTHPDGMGGTDTATSTNRRRASAGGRSFMCAPASIRSRSARRSQRRGGIGNIAVGALAIGGLACGLFTLGGASIGLLVAVGGAALGLGVSVGGLAVGSIAVGGLAVGFVYAIGGGAFGPAAIDGRHCDEAARAFVRRWLDVALPSCR